MEINSRDAHFTSSSSLTFYVQMYRLSHILYLNILKYNAFNGVSKGIGNMLVLLSIGQESLRNPMLRSLKQAVFFLLVVGGAHKYIFSLKAIHSSVILFLTEI